MRKLTALWFVMPLILSGCATLSKDECLAGNWRNIGFKDGANGYTSARLSEHTEACAEYRVMPDQVAYQRGREEGLYKVYCKHGKGFDEGRAGTTYQYVCPKNREDEFMDGYISGLEARREDLSRDIDRKQDELFRAISRQRDASRIYDEKKRKKREDEADDEYKRLESEMDTLRNQRRDTEDLLNRVRRSYSRY